MIVIVGLGNPGQKFQKTRHNLGFRVVDEFVRENNFPDFGFVKKFDSLISEGFLDKQKIIIAKPQTYMNNSGKAVKKLIENWKLSARGVLQRRIRLWRRSAFGGKIENLFVIHDDIDLPLGKIRIAIGRGGGGHKGVQSIIDELRSKNFIRFRTGINHETCNMKHETSENFVLKKFNKGEEEILKEVIKKTVQAIKTATTEGIEKAMSEYN